ncbi:MAG TPA: DUF4203 domain-containing protein [Vicinamibacterales bacterium]|nr:DUF4203 domain-containing protein [Vicinamibacterales bacterium]
MLPHTYEPAAAVLLVLGGALSCFAGYRLFRIVLAIYGFILGGSIASSTLAGTNATGQLLAWVIGGFAGALILVLAYFVGIALIGAGLGALIAHLGWTYFGTGDPPPLLVVALAILGAIGAMVLQRYVIVVATAFGGAWTLLLGAVAMMDRRAAAAARSADVWVFYPMAPAPDQRWLPVAWIALGLLGTAVQLGVTGRKRT